MQLYAKGLKVDLKVVFIFLKPRNCDVLRLGYKMHAFQLYVVVVTTCTLRNFFWPAFWVPETHLSDRTRERKLAFQGYP